MRVEVLTVGTELLLGQIVDTNSTMIGRKLAENGLDSLFAAKVGDNHRRIVDAIRAAMARSDALIICGGLGPTQDDITREAIAEVMGVVLEENQAARDAIVGYFASRNRAMPENNLRQALVPRGASTIEARKGTAPGLICPLGNKVIYAAPGVPYELEDMLDRAILPDLIARSGRQGVIVSRTLRTWGLYESALAERVAPVFDALEASGEATIAFLASGVEGIKLRITTKAENEVAAQAVLDRIQGELAALIGEHIFGLDDETMEHAVGALLIQRGVTLAVAESVSGGLVASRIVDVPGASKFFRGGVVSYATEVKRSLLEVRAEAVVSEACAIEMAQGVRKLLGSDFGLSLTGVAGPESQDDQPVGTVWIGIADEGGAFATMLSVPGDRSRIRGFATISAMDLLRRHLGGIAHASQR